MQARIFELADPAFCDVIDRDGIDEMESLPSLTFPRDEIGLLENGEMFRDRLAGHAQPLAKLSERLPILPVKLVKELATASVRQCSKNGVIVHLEIGNLLVPCS